MPPWGTFAPANLGEGMRVVADVTSARRFAVLGVVSALAVLVPVAGARASSGPTFTRTTVAANWEVGEPRLFTDPSSPGPKFFDIGPGWDAKGNINTFLWWSSDGVHYSGPATTNQGSGDSDIAIDANHTVYAADLFDAKGNSTLPISVWN